MVIMALLLVSAGLASCSANTKHVAKLTSVAGRSQQT
jgi:hypothetical protein